MRPADDPPASVGSQPSTFDPIDLVAIEPPDPRERARLALAPFADLAREPGRLVALAATLLGLIVVAALAWVLLRPEPPAVEDVLPLASATTAPVDAAPASGAGAVAPESGATTAPAEVLVHAAGAVAAPGVYELPAGSRIADLVQAAGGPAPDADLDRLNLAEVLLDGSRVYVPRVDETEPPAVVVPSGGSGAAATPGAGGGTDGEPSGPIDLNRATAAELEELPGVGPATAAAILSHRVANGPFGSVDDLLDVRGIGEAKLDALRDLVMVG